MGLHVLLAWVSGTPGLPDLPVMSGISPPDPGWLTGSGGVLLVSILTVSFGAVGYFLSRQLRTTQMGVRAHSRDRATRIRPEPRKQPTPVANGRVPLLQIPDPDRRVGIADVRLLQRFGAGVDFRRVLGPFHAEVDSRLPQGTPVILCVEFNGASPGQVELDLDGLPAFLEHDPGPGDVDGRHWIRYDYLPERHGSPMRFTVKYPGPGGTPVREQYQTRHGFRELEFLEAPETGSEGGATAGSSLPIPRSTPSFQTAR
ncbi:MAG: hypothetical protein JNL10_17895 [Verrucomicrobiales bacterium]|nr:hypothetical protein [Verrucomicrobiales bacterium]